MIQNLKNNLAFIPSKNLNLIMGIKIWYLSQSTKNSLNKLIKVWYKMRSRVTNKSEQKIFLILISNILIKMSLKETFNLFQSQAVTEKI